MAEVKLSDVAKLRKMTGAGMMDCKKALEESNCDFEKAVELIRERGKAIANKRADREATEGVVLAASSKCMQKAGLVTLNCETDFVAKNADFQSLAEKILKHGISSQVTTLEELKNLVIDGKSAEALVQEFSGVTGEKMELSYYKFIKAEYTAVYIHPGSKLAAIVGVNKADADKQLVHDIAMQIAGMNPVAIDPESVPAAVREKELEIGREQARLEGKPENMLDKIAEGKLKKFFKENTLMEQEFVKLGKVTVADHMASVDKDLRVVAFDRYSLMD